MTAGHFAKGRWVPEQREPHVYLRSAPFIWPYALDPGQIAELNLRCNPDGLEFNGDDYVDASYAPVKGDLGHIEGFGWFRFDGGTWRPIPDPSEK